MQIAEFFKQYAVNACRYTFFSIMILCYSECIHIATGQLTLSPMTVAPVCHVGDPLNLTCKSSIRFITWSISGPRVNEQGDLENVINDEPLNSEDPLQMPRPIMISLANFTFMRISGQGELPLITTLSINSVSLGLNGTVVRCIPQRQYNMSMPASTTIQIIDTSQKVQLISGLNISEQHYNAANVTVTVEWDKQEPGIEYYIEVLPSVPIENSTDSETRYQLTIPYDETFNFSVMASTPCRPNDTALIILNYAKCDDPRDLLSEDSNVSVSMIEGYSGFPVEGSTVRFSCPSGQVLLGSHSAKCTENGKWEPDLNQLTCNSGQQPPDPKDYTIIIITSAVAVTLILLCTTLVTTAALLYRKGKSSKKQRTECVHSDKQVTAKDVYADKGNQYHPKDLVYADVSVSSKHKKRKKQTLKPTQAHNFDVEYSAVDHNLTVHGYKHELKVSKDDSLDVCLDTLLFLLHEQVSPKWREFGEAVEIDDMVLDSIASTCSPETYFVELLDYWLKYYDGRPTWSDIAEALYDIDLQKLAQDIEHVYETGKLPESEMDIIYINVTSSLPQFKPSAKAPHKELHVPEVLARGKAPCGPYNDCDLH